MHADPRDPTAAADAPAARASAFFGRRVGKALRPLQAETLARVMDRLGLDLARPAPAVLGDLYAHAPAEIRLEIGFGGGEHLVHRAEERPDVGFIGVEPFVNGMAKAAMQAEAAGLSNLRLTGTDAMRVLDWLPPASLAAVLLLYPDPWQKKKHWKRRFVGPDSVARIARVLRPGGVFQFASDIDGYVDWTLRHLRAHPGFRWTASRPDDWRRPWEGWPGTRYEAKAIREGRRGTYLTFARTDAPADPVPPAGP